MKQGAEDILRLKACPECGYDLEALPRDHQCPECGYAYTADLSMIPVLKKEEVPRLFVLLSWSVMSVLFFMIALAGFSSIIIVLISGTAPPLGIYIVVLVMGGCAGSCLFGVREQLRGRRLLKSVTPEMTHVLLLCQTGYSLQGTRQSGEWTSWSEVPETFMTPHCHGLWRLRLRTNWWRTLFLRQNDLFIKASRRDAEALRERIRSFMDESEGPE